MFKKIITFSFVLFHLYSKGQIKAKPNEYYKYKWAVGVGTGNVFLSSDVIPVNPQFSFGLHFYKPIAKWFGVNVNYTHGNAYGQNYKASENFGKNPAWNNKYSFPYRLPTGPLTTASYVNGVFTQTAKSEIIYYNYKSKIDAISTSAEFTLPLPYARPRVGIHLSFGVGLIKYNTKIDALNNNGTYSNLFKDAFDNALTNGRINKNEILKKLKNGMDHIYETEAEGRSKSFHFTKNLGIGLSYRFKKRYIVGIDQTAYFTKSDFIDGQRWQEYAYGDPVITRDFDIVNINTIKFVYFFD